MVRCNRKARSKKFEFAICDDGLQDQKLVTILKLYVLILIPLLGMDW